MSHHLLGDREVCDAGSGLGRWAPRWYLTHLALTLLASCHCRKLDAFIYAGCCLELQGWEGRRLQAGDHWEWVHLCFTTGYGIALQKGSPWKRQIDLAYSSLWVMVRLWLTSPTSRGTGDPHTLCF